MRAREMAFEDMRLAQIQAMQKRLGEIEHVVAIERQGDALAIAALTHAQDCEITGVCVSRLELRRMALEWIELRGIEVSE